MTTDIKNLENIHNSLNIQQKVFSVLPALNDDSFCFIKIIHSIAKNALLLIARVYVNLFQWRAFYSEDRLHTELSTVRETVDNREILTNIFDKLKIVNKKLYDELKPEAVVCPNRKNDDPLKKDDLLKKDDPLPPPPLRKKRISTDPLEKNIGSRPHKDLFLSKNGSLPLESTEAPPEVKEDFGHFIKQESFPVTSPRVIPFNRAHFFHLHANEFGANSEGYEGTRFEFFIPWLNAYLEELKPNYPSLNIDPLLQLQEALLSPNPQQAFKQAIQTMQIENRSVLLPGGWVGDPGHAILVEAVPNGNGKVDLRFYNSGAGADLIPSLKKGYKTQIPIYTVFENVELSLLQRDDIIKTFIDLRNIESHGVYGAQHIYGSLKSLLKPQSINYAKEEKSGQLSGICVFFSIKYYLSKILSKGDFKQLILNLRLKSLDDLKLEDLNVEDIPLLENSLKGLSHKVKHSYQAGLIGEAYLKRALGILQNKEQILENLKNASLKLKLFEERKNLTSPFAMKRANSIASDLLQNRNHFIYPSPLTHRCRFASGFNELGRLIANTDSIEARDGIEFFVEEFPLERLNQDLGPLNTQQLEYFISSIKLCSERYFYLSSKHATSTENIASKDAYYTSIKLLYIQAHAVARLTGFPLEEMLKSEVFYRTAHDFPSNQDETVRHFKETQQKDLSTIFAKGTQYSRALYTYEANLALEEKSFFVIFYRDNIPGNAHVNISKDMVKKAAEWLSSDQPPQYIKDLRDTLIFCSSPRFYNLNPKIQERDLILTYRVKENSWSTRIHLEPVTRVNPTSVTKKNIFLATFPPLKNEVLNRFVDVFLGSFYNQNENGLLDCNLHDLVDANLTENSLKELAHILLRIKNHKNELNPCQIPELVHYFSKYPHLLEDSDYQSIFEYSLFSSAQIKNAHPVTLKHLQTFIQNQIEQTQQTDSCALLFYIRLSRHISSYVPEFKIFQAKELLLKVAKEERTPIEVKSLAYLEYLAELGTQDSLTNEEAIEVFIAKAFLLENGFDKSTAIPHLEQEAAKAYNKHVFQIQRITTSDDNFFKEIATKVLSSLRAGLANSQWTFSMLDGRLESNDGKILYYPWSHTLQTTEGDVYLPQRIKNDPHFKELFGNRNKARIIAPNIYAIGDEYLLKFDQENLTIERKIHDKWCRYVPRESLYEKNERANNTNYFLKAGNLVKEYHHFCEISEERPILYLFDKNKDTLTYGIRVLKYANGTYLPQEIRRLKDGKCLSPYSDVLPFNEFEDLHFINAWNHDEIELPRYGLTFTRVQNRWEISIDGVDYTVVENQKAKSFGQIKGYLYLRASNGKALILYPDQDFKKIEKPCSIQHKYEVDRHTNCDEASNLQFYPFTLGTNGQILSSSKEGYLKLVSALLASGEYELAANYLRRHGKKLTPYTEKETKILRQITQIQSFTGDTSGEACGIKLYTLYLLLEQQPHNKNLLEELATTYNQYLLHFSHVTALKLKKKEEIALLQLLLNETSSFQTSFYQRLKDLDPKKAREIKIEKAVLNVSRKELPDIQIELKVAVLSAIKPVERPGFNLAEFYISNPKNSYINFFSEFYRIARQGTKEERSVLESSFAFGKELRDGHLSSHFAILYIVFHHSDQFPIAFETRDEFDQIKEIATKLIPRVNLKLIEEELLEYQKTERGFIDKKRYEEKPLSSTVHSVPVLSKTETLSTQFQPFFSQESVSDSNDISEQMISYYMERLKKTSSSTENKEWERLIDDLYGEEATAPKFYWTITNKKDLNTLLSLGYKNEVDNLETDLLTQANVQYQMGHAEALKRLEILEGKRSVISLEEILFAYAKQEGASLKNKNPALTDQQITALFQTAGKFLHLACLEQQRNRALDLLNKLDHAHTEIETKELTHQLGVCLLTKRTYKPEVNPSFLVFEYFGNLLLREAQVKKLEEFTEKGDLNPIMEMIMGSGKSKVLMPLLAFLRANGEQLSMLIIPEPLFKTVSTDIQHSLNSCGMDTYAFDFQRNSPTDLTYLKTITHNLLACIKEEPTPVLTTNKAVQCFVLKYVELLHQEGRTPSVLEMEKILYLFLSSGVPLLDEVDTLLDVLHEVNFALGSKKNPPTFEIDTVSSIFSTLYSKFSAIVPPITEKQYKEIQLPLINAWIDSLQFSSKDEVRNFYNQLKDKKLLAAYLSRDPAQIKACQEFYNAQSDTIKNILALASEEFCEYLPHTLQQKTNENYGALPDHSNPIAMPYRAANIPSIGSEFSNTHITMNYTFQYYREKGIPLQFLKTEIEEIKAAALKEMVKEPDRPFNQTTSFKRLEALRLGFPIHLFSYSEQDLINLAAHLNSSDEQKLQFVSQVIIPKIELFPFKLSANSHHLVLLFKQLAGFTGTLWNSKSMHSRLNTFAALGTDSKTIYRLFKNSMDSTLIVEGESLDALKQLELQPQMIADSGGYFIEGGNRAIADNMANHYKRPVVFYTESGEQLITDGKEARPFNPAQDTPDKRITFLDQSRTTGADVPQTLDAIAINTIGPKIKLRDILQTAWRLRGLEGSQKVVFVVSEKVAGMIRETLQLEKDAKITFKEILAFAVKNQAAAQEKNNFRAFLRELAVLPEMLLIKGLSDPKISEVDKEKMTIDLKNRWIKETLFEPKELFGQIAESVDSQKVIDDLLDKAHADIHKLYFTYPALREIGPNLDTYLNQIEEQFNGYLPKKIVVPIREGNADETVEIQNAVQNQTQKEVDRVNLHVRPEIRLTFLNGNEGYKDTIFSPRIINWYNKELIPMFDLGQVLNEQGFPPALHKAFSNLKISLNLFEWKVDNKWPLPLFGTFRHPFKYFVRESGKMLLISHEEAQDNCKDVIDTQLGYIQQDRALSQEELLAVVQTKFLNGESDFKKSEEGILREWVSKNNPPALKKFFIETILQGQPEKAIRYQNSLLKTLF